VSWIKDITDEEFEKDNELLLPPAEVREWILERLAEPFGDPGIPAGGDVGMDSGGGRDPGVVTGQRERPGRRLGRLAHHHQVSHPRRRRSRNHLGNVRVECGVTEVAVGVYQHQDRISGPAAACGLPGPAGAGPRAAVRVPGRRASAAR